jgi:hypothetical protein
MRYFKISNEGEGPDAPALGLARFEVQKDKVITETYNAESGEWEHFAGVIQFTGIGGDNPYREIPEDEAMKILEGLKA